MGRLSGGGGGAATSNPKVSVIIPVYNAAVSLPRSLNSALSQDLQSQEVIVINDGSTDGTGDVVRSYRNLIVRAEQENQGQAAARNAGLQLAKGEYVAFLDADDYWLPGFLSRCVEFLEAHADAAAVNTGQLIKVWGKKGKIRPVMLLRQACREGAGACVLDDFFSFWGRHDHIRTGSSVMRRAVVEAAGGQRTDLRLAEDLEFWGYLATFGRWGFIPEVLFVSDGSAAAASVGWMQKYQARGRLCPTVEEWQRRIVPRLKEQDWAGFRLMRGRVAASFAHSKILASDDRTAFEIVVKYGTEFGVHWSTRLMQRAATRYGGEWHALCRLFRMRERTKSFLVSLTAALAKVKPDVMRIPFYR